MEKRTIIMQEFIDQILEAIIWKMYCPHSLSFSSVLLVKKKKRRKLKQNREEEVRAVEANKS